jgi:cold shock CspA family protein
VFIHANELRRSGIADLTPIVTGTKLEFDVEVVEGKGPKAIDIKLVPGESVAQPDATPSSADAD